MEAPRRAPTTDSGPSLRRTPATREMVQAAVFRIRAVVKPRAVLRKETPRTVQRQKDEAAARIRRPIPHTSRKTTLAAAPRRSTTKRGRARRSLLPGRTIQTRLRISRALLPGHTAGRAPESVSGAGCKFQHGLVLAQECDFFCKTVWTRRSSPRSGSPRDFRPFKGRMARMGNCQRWFRWCKSMGLASASAATACYNFCRLVGVATRPRLGNIGVSAIQEASGI